MRAVLSTSALVVLLLLAAAAVPTVDAQQCGDSTSCLGLAEGAACGYVDGKATTTITCGKCVTSGTCVRACVANSDQSTCAFMPSCTKNARASNGGPGLAAACGTTRVINGDAFKEPASFTSSNGKLNLTISVQLVNWNATAFTMTSRMYCVGLAGSGTSTCSVPAAQIHVKPGDVLTVTLVNNLPTDYTESKAMNTLRTPNVVNMHTHGFHVDPAIDNVMFHISPGGSWTYSYSIPSDHLPGNHWYHSHVHGASSLQVMGGMAGMLFVDPPTGWTPPNAAYAAMASHAVQLSHICMCTCNPTTDPFAYRSYPFLQAASGDNLAPHNFVQQPGYTETDVVLVNGQYQPQLTLAPGEWRRLDIVNAVGTIYQEIEIRTAVAGGTAPCSMVLLSNDGILLRASRTVTMVPMPPAGRVSVAIMCSSAGTYYLSTYPQVRASDYEAQLKQNLITLNVAGTAVSMTSPLWTTSAVTYPYYLSDLTSVSTTNNLQFGVDQTAVDLPAGNWLGVGTDCANPAGNGNTASPNSYGSCAYMPFMATGSYRFATPGCSVVNLTINGRGLSPHPIHMHVHVSQIVNSVDNTGKQTTWTSVWGPYGEFRDTIPAVQGPLNAKFRAAAFRGAIMVHCHFLFHEDMGMMDRYWTGETTSTACLATSVANNCNASVPAAAFLTTFDQMPLTCPGQPTTSPTTTTTAGSTSATTAATTTTTSPGASPTPPTTAAVGSTATPTSSTTTSPGTTPKPSTTTSSSASTAAPVKIDTGALFSAAAPVTPPSLLLAVALLCMALWTL